jgi:hypothetical protein
MESFDENKKTKNGHGFQVCGSVENLKSEKTVKFELEPESISLELEVRLELELAP